MTGARASAGRGGLLLATLLAALAAFARGGGRGDVPADSLPAELPRLAPLGLPALAIDDARAARAALGRRLFFDPLLSRDRSVACASCHDPELGFADDEPLSEGVDGARTLRNAPTLLNRAFGEAFLWDGRAPTLEEQVLLPIEDGREMALELPAAVERLRDDARYAEAFDAVFGGPPTRDALSQALAAFVGSLFLGDSPVDRFRDGDVRHLSTEEKQGFWLYESRAGCWRCHGGANFTDEGFHNTGIGAAGGVPEDGRFAVTGDDADRGAFKTPTLRGLALTAPYMHDGGLATLEDVVEHYRRGGIANSHLDPLMKPLELSERDAANLVAFLRSLSRSVGDEEVRGR